jgi:hypothetical protein
MSRSSAASSELAASAATCGCAYSRFCIRCEVVTDADALAVEHILDSAFREFGIPAATRSDNGPPFSALGPAGLTNPIAVNGVLGGLHVDYGRAA